MRSILLVAMLLHGSSIWATEAITLEQPPLIACAFPQRPWAFTDENGTIAGIAVDVHAYFQRTTGRNIRTEACPIRFASERLKEGSIDLALLPEVQGLSENDEQFKLRLELMTEIFKANVILQEGAQA